VVGIVNEHVNDTPQLGGESELLHASASDSPANVMHSTATNDAAAMATREVAFLG
jgi:hypothetical protein